jgi:hypothetical protein
MSIPLAQLQSVVQRSILEGDNATLAFLKPPPNDTPEVMFGVYKHAYAARLIEVVGNDHEYLKAYLGDEQFNTMARGYLRAYPSHNPNARWFAHRLPEFLAQQKPWSDHPELVELAKLERALNDAFDAPDAPLVTFADLQAFDPTMIAAAILTIHPSMQLLKATTNVTSIWSALKSQERPPKAAALPEPIDILVWRQSSASRFRLLGAEEAMAIGEAAKAVPFGVLCEMVAVMNDAGTAALRAGGYLRGWIEAELISAIRAERRGEK